LHTPAIGKQQVILPLNTFFLIGNTVLLALLAVILLKDHFRSPSAVLGAILALSAAAVGMFPIVIEWDVRWLEPPLNLLCAAAAVAFLLLAKALFEDNFRWQSSYLLLYALSVLLGFFGNYLTFGDFRGMTHWFTRSDVSANGLWLMPLVLFTSALVLLALYVAFKDWRSDLVESRRRARLVSVTLAAFVLLATTTIEFSSLGTPRSQNIDTTVSGLYFLLILGICVRYLGFRARRTARSTDHVFPSKTLEEVEAQEGAEGATMVSELNRLMQEEKIYREEGITIRRLADRLNIREYRLRRLINGHLGYRNFNSFLNRYRIEAVARQLVAPETRHLPVLSIALDMGYRSLSTFNKAFKEIMGMTPTEYRQQRPAGGQPGGEKRQKGDGAN